jgi:hypothetical protein
MLHIISNIASILACKLLLDIVPAELIAPAKQRLKQIMKKQMLVSVAVVGLAGLALLPAPALAVDFDWSFKNTAGNVGLPSDTVSGTIFGLADNSFNNQSTIVTVDLVSPSVTSPFTVPMSFTSFGTFPVFGGVLASVGLNHISWSGVNGAFALNLDVDNPQFWSNNGFTKYYLSGGSITFTPHSTPDGGSALMLLGMGLTGFGLLRRKLA